MSLRTTTLYEGSRRAHSICSSHYMVCGLAGRPAGCHACVFLSPGFSEACAPVSKAVLKSLRPFDVLVELPAKPTRVAYLDKLRGASKPA